MNINVESDILKLVNTHPLEDSRKYAKQHGLKHIDVVGVLKSLESANMLKLVQKEEKAWILTEEGQTFATNGRAPCHFLIPQPPSRNT